MDLHELLRLVIAAIAGTLMGSFLLLTLIHRPLIKKELDHNQCIFIYRRFYRLNASLSLLGGLIAAVFKMQYAAFVLAILSTSYIFANMHIIKAFISQWNTAVEHRNQRALTSLKLLQNSLHFLQFLGAGYVIYYLI